MSSAPTSLPAWRRFKGDQLSEAQVFLLELLDQGPAGEASCRKALMGAGFINAAKTMGSLVSKGLIRKDAITKRLYITLEADRFRQAARPASREYDEWVE